MAEEYYTTVPEMDLYHYLPNETSGGPGKTRSFTCPRYRRFPIDLVTRRLTYRGTYARTDDLCIISISIYIYIYYRKKYVCLCMLDLRELTVARGGDVNQG